MFRQKPNLKETAEQPSEKIGITMEPGLSRGPGVEEERAVPESGTRRGAEVEAEGASQS